MIARVRPRFLEEKEEQKKVEPFYDDRLYFSSGSGAAGFFFEQYRYYYEKTPKVGIQTLTCSTMGNALLKSGAEVHLFDISKKDLGLRLEDIKDVQLDVIVLTSYQGIPSDEYEKIGEYCKEKNIILFEDLAHGTETRTDGLKLGSLSNVYIESYCWDKPYAAIHGGSLSLNNLPLNFKQYIYDAYTSLPVETKKHAIRDRNNVLFGMRYTLDKNYDGDFPETNFYQYPILKMLYSKRMFQYALYRKSLLIIYKVLRRLFKEKRENLYRLHDVKIGFINQQRNNFKTIGEDLESLYLLIEKLSESLGVKDQVHVFKQESCIEWNRFSIIDSSGKIKQILKKEGICADNYNWKSCLHHEFPQTSSCIYHGPFPNAEFVSKNIVNIPIWCKWWEVNNLFEIGKGYESNKIYN